MGRLTISGLFKTFSNSSVSVSVSVSVSGKGDMGGMGDIDGGGNRNIGGSRQFNALNDINLEIADKELICIIGPSGCGKTTLLRIVAGLDMPTSGSIYLDDVLITGPTPDTGFVFQEYSLFPWKTVIENIEFGTTMRAMDKEGRHSASMRYLKLVGLEGFARSYPYELSGGMKQRVAIARALANNPKVLLMDEPFGALDAQTRNTLQVELLSIWEKDKKTIMFVTHSVDEAVFLADRIVVMGAEGGIVDIHDIDMPRPRDRTGVDANRYRNELLELLRSEREKMEL